MNNFKNSSFLLLPLLALLSFTSCQNSKDASLALEVGMNKSTLALRTSSDDFLVFTSGEAIIREVEFEGLLQGKDGGPQVISYENVITIDLATGASTPSLPELSIPTGTYEEPDLEIELHPEDNQPALWVEGEYTHTNSNIIPIRFVYDDEFEFEAEAETFTFMSDQPVLGVLTLDPIFWFSGVSRSMLDNAVISQDGFIIISVDSNRAIYDLVRSLLNDNNETTFQ